MCLELRKNVKLFISKRNKIVFKYVIEQAEDGIYTTLFQRSKVTIGDGSIVTSDLILQKNMYGNDVCEIGLHSFPSIASALKVRGVALLEDYKNSFNVRLVKCWIPIGTKYYMGKFHSSTSCASDKLIYREVVNIEHDVHVCLYF